jgi:hypothetical protein
MELATGPERTIDGIANGREVVLGHPKTREAMRAGLAMYFVTLEDAGLMELANKIVAELGIEHFFNIQLVGEYVIEINPRISTIVYQEDLNLPYLGVKRAIGETSCGRSRHGSAPDGPHCVTSTSSSGTREQVARLKKGTAARGPIPNPHPPTGQWKRRRRQGVDCHGFVPSS